MMVILFLTGRLLHDEIERFLVEYLKPIVQVNMFLR